MMQETVACWNMKKATSSDYGEYAAIGHPPLCQCVGVCCRMEILLFKIFADDARTVHILHISYASVSKLLSTTVDVCRTTLHNVHSFDWLICTVSHSSFLDRLLLLAFSQPTMLVACSFLTTSNTTTDKDHNHNKEVVKRSSHSKSIKDSL